MGRTHTKAPVAGAFGKGKPNRVNAANDRVKRYAAKKAAKGQYLKAKAEAYATKQGAKNAMSTRKYIEAQKTARHAAWAGAVSNALGKSSNVAQSAIKQSMNYNDLTQNTNGGLVSTQKSRDDDEEEQGWNGVM